jgi:hypothetical protein
VTPQDLDAAMAEIEQAASDELGQQDAAVILVMTSAVTGTYHETYGHSVDELLGTAAAARATSGRGVHTLDDATDPGTGDGSGPGGGSGSGSGSSSGSSWSWGGFLGAVGGGALTGGLAGAMVGGVGFTVGATAGAIIGGISYAMDSCASAVQQPNDTTGKK